MGDLNITRNMVANALSDKFSPQKVDKFEAIEIKEKLTKNGGQVSEASRAFLADQVNAGRYAWPFVLKTCRKP